MVWQWEGSRDRPRLARCPHQAHSPEADAADASPDPIGPPEDCLSRLSRGAGASVPREKLEPRPSSGGLPLRRLNGHSVHLGLPPQCLHPHCPSAGRAPPRLPHSWLLLSSRVAFRGARSGGMPPQPQLSIAAPSVWLILILKESTFTTNARVRFQTHQRWATGGVVSLQGRGLLATPQHSSALPTLGPHGSLRRARNTVTGQHVLSAYCVPDVSHS